MDTNIRPLVMKTLDVSDHQRIEQLLANHKLSLPQIVPEGMPMVHFTVVRLAGLFKSAVRVYLPVHLLSLLLRLRNPKQSKKAIFKRFFIELGRSLVYSTIYGYAMPLSASWLRPLYNLIGNSWTAVLIAGFLSSAILFESRSRLSEMSLYVLGQWIQAYSYSVKKRGYISDIPHLEKVVLGCALGIMAALYYSSSHSPEDQSRGASDSKAEMKIESMIRLIIGDKVLKF